MRTLAVYALLSVALLFAQPGYSLIGAWAILLGGSAGSLSLAVACLPDFYQQRLDGISYFNPEAALACSGAVLIWSIGAIIAFRCFKSRNRFAYCVALVCIWIIGSIYNTFWFAIRSV